MIGRLLVALVLALAPASGVFAGPSPEWSTVRLPGSPEFLAEEAGLKFVPSSRVRFMRDFARLLHAGRSNVTVEKLRLTFILLQELDTRLTAALVNGRLSIDHSNRKTLKPVESLLDLLGYDVRISKGKVAIRVRGDDFSREQREVFKRVGLPLDNVIAALERGESAAVEIPFFEVPLPLTPEYWSTNLMDRPTGTVALMGTIIADPKLALTYVGLFGLDPDTLNFFRDHPSLTRRVANDYAALFGGFSRSLHIRDGRVETPGGEEAAKVWADLVGGQQDKAESFIELLFSADKGRLAWFYDVAAQLPGDTRRFMLSSWEKDAKKRQRRVERAYRVFQNERPGWDFRLRPFDRPDSDPTFLILSWASDATGRPLGATSKRFWADVLGSVAIPAEVSGPANAIDDDDLIDAGTLVDLIADPVRERAARAQALALGQSLSIRFASTTPAELGTMVRGALRFPALVRVLERMPITQPATIVGIVQQADRLSAIGAADRLAANLTQFQSLIALIDRASNVAEPQSGLVDELLQSLAAVTLDRNERYSGALVTWFKDQLLQATIQVVDAAPASSPAKGEHAIRAWLAGMTLSRPTAELEWEGWRYRADPAEPRFRDLSKIRGRQRQLSVDELVSLLELVNSLPQITTIAAVKAAAVQLRTAGEALGIVPADEMPGIDPFPSRATIDDAAERLEQIRSTNDLRRLNQIRDDLLPALDAIAASAFRALAYASFLGDPAGPLLLSGDVGPRHDFGLGDLQKDARTPWALPEIGTGSTKKWRVRGSILGLDHGLASLVLRDSVDGMPPVRGYFDPSDRLGLIRSALAFQPEVPWTSDRLRAVAEAIQKGRSSVPSSPSEIDGRWEWRYHALDWVTKNEPSAAVMLFGISDYMAFSRAAIRPAFDPFGAQLLPVTGSLRPRMPPSMVWEAIAGHLGSGILASWTPDLKLRVAELMNEIGLPGILGPIVTAKAAIAFAQVAPPALDDWGVVMERICRVTRNDIVDLVAALTADGTLIPLTQ